MSTQFVDHEARRMATAAHSAILTHEQVCAQRWKAAMDSMGDIKRIVSWAAVSLIGSMAGLIAWLATHPPH